MLFRSYSINGKPHKIWFPPDELWRKAGVNLHSSPVQVNQGDEIIRLLAHAGDHLFVDRLTFNFRPPRRGDITVFQTAGIASSQQQAMPQDQFYIKRLVALPNETVSIGDDRHLVINGRRLDKTEPGFEKLYDETLWPKASDGSLTIGESVYQGHLNGPEKFPNSAAKVTVPPDGYLVFGDNTSNSFDSRFWGKVPRTNVIGRSFFVYWPFIKRAPMESH